jgi:methionyl-tRNA formyltransferase
LKVLILSTATKHHTYFIQKIYEQFEIVGLVYERRRLVKDYQTGPFYEEEASAFEERFFNSSFKGVPRELPEPLMKRMVEVYSVNQAGMSDYLRALEPDIAVTFGVGYVKSAIFSIPRWGTINVHRGISQYYRGLDSDLWAIYHGRFDQIGVTIHYVDERLDTGNILAQERVTIEPQDEIFHLRYKTTLTATKLVIGVLAWIEKLKGKIHSTPQLEEGPYYSAMPLQLKEEALRNFIEYKASLVHASP